MSRAKLKNLVKKLTIILKELLSFHLMLPGSFNEVYCKCGKENCWCHDKDGHPFRRITWSENGLSKTKAIPKEDTNWIINVTKSYRIFRKKRREIKKLEKQLKGLLDDYEKNIIQKTRKLKNYL